MKGVEEDDFDWQEPDYVKLLAWRQQQLIKFETDRKLAAAAIKVYSTRAAAFISHWVDTFDPRNAATSGMTRMPFVLFPRQVELIDFFDACLHSEADGLVEKSRDMGVTWAACAYSVWLWLFLPGSSVGWGSRKADLVDRRGDVDSIFEKMRMIINGLPAVFLPKGFNDDEHLLHMRIVNPANGSSITGESGDEIGRGGRKSVYFVDEAAHVEHPESIEASLSENTRVRFDVSSVSEPNSVFHRKREAGTEFDPRVGPVKGVTNVLVLDWRDNPKHTREWYQQRRGKAEADGLLHLFEREIERNYFAAVQGVIIPHHWVMSAIDAHYKINGMEDGGWVAGLDVADEGSDRNALVKRKGVVVKDVFEWGECDTGETARRAVDACSDTLPIDLFYDSIGVGAGVKAEANRLRKDGVMPPMVKVYPWNAGAQCLDPEDYVGKLPSGAPDKQTPKNKDFYMNLKAQAWWQTRLRFERTHLAITQNKSYDPDMLISIDSTSVPHPLLLKLEKELSQPTIKKTSSMRLVVDKQPEGTRSPNLADAFVISMLPTTTGPMFIPQAALNWARTPRRRRLYG